MQIIDLIEMHPGVDNARQLAELASKDPDSLKELWELTYHDRAYISRVAAWAIEYCFLEHPEKVKPYIPFMIERLPELPTNSLRRHFLKMIWLGGFGKEHHGVLAHICFQWITEPNKPVAVKMFSMQVLFVISESEPDIKPELAAVIEHQLPNATPGLKNAGSKILKKLYQKTGN